MTDKIADMAKKLTSRKSDSPSRTDADRRARQSERIARHLHVLQCIMGPGRWDAESLATELECSPRTVHRILQTLSTSGVPWYFCKDSNCYRVRAGFRFPGLDKKTPLSADGIDSTALLAAANQLINQGERFLESLRLFCKTLDSTSDT